MVAIIALEQHRDNDPIVGIAVSYAYCSCAFRFTRSSLPSRQCRLFAAEEERPPEGGRLSCCLRDQKNCLAKLATTSAIRIPISHDSLSILWSGMAMSDFVAKVVSSA